MGVNCKVCHGPVEDDGYGEYVHTETGLYGAYMLHGFPSADPRDKYAKLTHVAV